jgi:hypothetical protein
MEPPCLQDTTAKTLAMAGTTEPLLLTPTKQCHRRSGYFAWGWKLAAAAVLVMLLLLAVASPLHHHSLPETVELTLLTGAVEKGAGTSPIRRIGFFLAVLIGPSFRRCDFISVCLDGTAPGYQLQRGSGSGSKSWLVHLEVDTTTHTSLTDLYLTYINIYIYYYHYSSMPKQVAKVSKKKENQIEDETIFQ